MRKAQTSNSSMLTPYDIDSIMHYGMNYFSKNMGLIYSLRKDNILISYAKAIVTETKRGIQKNEISKLDYQGLAKVVAKSKAFFTDPSKLSSTVRLEQTPETTPKIWIESENFDFIKYKLYRKREKLYEGVHFDLSHPIPINAKEPGTYYFTYSTCIPGLAAIDNLIFPEQIARMQAACSPPQTEEFEIENTISSKSRDAVHSHMTALNSLYVQLSHSIQRAQHEQCRYKDVLDFQEFIHAKLKELPEDVTSNGFNFSDRLMNTLFFGQRGINNRHGNSYHQVCNKDDLVRWHDGTCQYDRRLITKLLLPQCNNEHTAPPSSEQPTKCKIQTTSCEHFGGIEVDGICQPFSSSTPSSELCAQLGAEECTLQEVSSLSALHICAVQDQLGLWNLNCTEFLKPHEYLSQKLSVDEGKSEGLNLNGKAAADIATIDFFDVVRTKPLVNKLENNSFKTEKWNRLREYFELQKNSSLHVDLDLDQMKPKGFLSRNKIKITIGSLTTLAGIAYITNILISGQKDHDALHPLQCDKLPEEKAKAATAICRAKRLHEELHIAAQQDNYLNKEQISNLQDSLNEQCPLPSNP